MQDGRHDQWRDCCIVARLSSLLRDLQQRECFMLVMRKEAGTVSRVIGSHRGNLRRRFEPGEQLRGGLSKDRINGFIAWTTHKQNDIDRSSTQTRADELLSLS